jgi:hypothetical protein
VRGGLPNVPVHDLVIHPRDRELVIATHGRGLYLMDVAPLQELTRKALAAPAHLCAVRPVVLNQPGKDVPPPPRTYAAPNPLVGATIWYHLSGRRAAGTLEVVAADGTTVARWPAAGEPGFHRIFWNVPQARVAVGEYRVRLRLAGVEAVTGLRIEAE